LNTSNAMAHGFLEAAGVDAARWTGGPGSSGLTVVSNILAVEVNPSGRFVDTKSNELESKPTYLNTGYLKYNNINY
ncbi:hypothetical protein ACJBUF_10555, partial [Streptococcus suis]